LNGISDKNSNFHKLFDLSHAEKFEIEKELEKEKERKEMRPNVTQKEKTLVTGTIADCEGGNGNGGTAVGTRSCASQSSNFILQLFNCSFNLCKSIRGASSVRNQKHCTVLRVVRSLPSPLSSLRPSVLTETAGKPPLRHPKEGGTADARVRCELGANLAD
jgi:hypothetical protein